MRLAHALNAVELPVRRERAPARPVASIGPAARPGDTHAWPAATAPGSAAVH
jgi:hypothetical protein